MFSNLDEATPTLAEIQKSISDMIRKGAGPLDDSEYKVIIGKLVSRVAGELELDVDEASEPVIENLTESVLVKIRTAALNHYGQTEATHDINKLLRVTARIVKNFIHTTRDNSREFIETPPAPPPPRNRNLS